MTEQAERVQRTPGRWLVDPHAKTMFRTDRPQGYEKTLGGCYVGTDTPREQAEANAAYIVKACNEYPKLLELAEAVQAYANAVEREVIPEGDMAATTTWHRLTACLWDVQEKARSQSNAESL